MKMRNKFLALFLAVSMTFSAGACGSSDADKQSDGKSSTENTAADKEDEKSDDVDYYAAAVEKMKEVTSMNANMQVAMDMKIEAAGESQTMSTMTSMDMSCLYDPVRMKADAVIDAGDGNKLETSIYAEMAEDGTYTLYSTNGTTWQSQTIDAADIAQYDAAGNVTGYMQESYNFQDAGTEQIDGKDARKYTGSITGDDMRQTLMSTGALNSLSNLGVDSSQLDTMLKDLGELPITLWIDEAEMYPVKYEMDMTSMLNSLMSGIISSMGDDAAGLTFEYTKATMEMTCSDYNAVSEFSIPDEAKAATPAA